MDKEYGYKLNSHLTCFQQSFIAQLVEHRTGIAEVMGSNPVGASEFFLGFVCNCLRDQSLFMPEGGPLVFQITRGGRFNVFCLKLTLQSKIILLRGGGGQEVLTFQFKTFASPPSGINNDRSLSPSVSIIITDPINPL